MKGHKAKRSAAQKETIRRWTIVQTALGYLLLVLCFLAVVGCVSQSIEMKNVAYAMRDLMQQKQTLLNEKHQLELTLFESQQFSIVEKQLAESRLPLKPGPRLEIVLQDGLDQLLVEPVSNESGEEDAWRSWLARLNQAQARMTTRSRRPDGWVYPLWATHNQPKPPVEKEQT